MDEVDFTAGITLRDGTVLTADVVGIDAAGLRYKAEGGEERHVPWAAVKAVMLATTDHMLESAGYLFSMAETVQAQERTDPYEADRIRRFGLGLLGQAAPRLCPLGPACGLAPGARGRD